MLHCIHHDTALCATDVFQDPVSTTRGLFTLNITAVGGMDGNHVQGKYTSIATNMQAEMNFSPNMYSSTVEIKLKALYAV